MERRSKQREGWRRGKYPEVDTKVVDFITHTIDDGTLYFTVRFTDQTSFCVRYACDMFAVGAELSDWQSGEFHIIREHMKPIRGPQLIHAGFYAGWKQSQIRLGGSGGTGGFLRSILRDDLQLDAHGFNDFAERTNVHIRAPFYLGTRRLLDVQRIRERFLCQIHGGAQFPIFQA